MNALLIGMMILLYTVQSLFCKFYSDHYPGREDLAGPVFTIVSGLVVAIVSCAITFTQFEISWITALLAIFNALALALYNTCLIRASGTGPYSVLMVFLIAGGILLPTLVARVAFGDHVSVGKLISILVVLISVYLISHKQQETYRNKTAFFLACAGLALGNGAYGTLLDVQQRLSGSEQKEEMVAVTYFLAMLFSAVILLFKEKGRFPAAFRQNKKSLFFLLACSVVVALAVNLFVFIIPLVNLTVLYTLDNASVFLLSVLSSLIFFKEKLSPLNIIGCGTLCAALVCISLF